MKENPLFKLKAKPKAKGTKLSDATLKSIGQRVVDFWIDTGQCMLCDASAGYNVPHWPGQGVRQLGVRPHADHCQLRGLK